MTYGGYSNQIVVDERYLLRVSRKLDLAAVGPLLCAGIELIPIQQINQAYERLLKSDVRYRFVIDLASLEQGAQWS